MARNKSTTEVVELDDTDIEVLEVADTEETPDEVEAEPTFSPKDLAKELGIDPKSFRRWLRANTPARANKGGRWVFTADHRDALIKLYNTRSAKGTEPELDDEVTEID